MELTKLFCLLILLPTFHLTGEPINDGDASFRISIVNQTANPYATTNVPPPPPVKYPELPDTEVEALIAVISRLGLVPVPYIYQYSCVWNPSRISSFSIGCNCSHNANTICHITRIVASSIDLIGGSIHRRISDLQFLEILDLSNNQLTGFIPESLGDLPRLRQLLLYKNQLKGPIPSTLGNLSSLTTLSLYRNLLSEKIPKDLRKLSNLRIMALELNRFTGEIPAELGDLTNLTELRLAENNLTGEIPPDLGKLKNLTLLDVGSNNLRGKLPDTFENLTSLYYFSAAANNLEGSIPKFIAEKWTLLSVLYLVGNDFEGPLPPEFFNMQRIKYLFISDLRNSGFSFPEKANMQSIYHLILRNCTITGPVPEYIATWKSLRYLDLSFNNLSGEIPVYFKDLNLNELFMSRNMLTGEAPDWISKVAYDKMDLSYNNFTGSYGQDKYFSRQEFRMKPNRNFTNTKREEYCGGKSKYDSLFINCGGPPVVVDGNQYDGDESRLNYYEEPAGKWIYTCAGGFWSTTSNSSDYIKNMTCGVSEKSLYRTGRLCPIALTYYAFCLHQGNYTVTLHFAETVFTKDEDYSSSGRRVFDVYIQGERVLTNFDIKKMAEGPNEEWPIDLPAIVKDNLLEIHLFWPGKGSLYNPPALNGPLLSAISINPSNPSNKLTALQIAGIVVGSVLTPLLVLAFLWQMGFLTDRDLDETKIEVAHGKYITLRQIITGTKKFVQTMKIGEGRFGQVYKSELKDEGITLAVKKISLRLLEKKHEDETQIEMLKKHKDEIQTEILNLTSLRHENLVRLLHRHSKKGLHLLIYEYLERGSLHQALFESETKPNWKERMEICLGIAKGLMYLHEENNLKPVHGNLRPKNIMLDENLKVKLSDFGLAMIYHDEPFMTLEPKEALITLAPECSFKPMTSASDVYSFGHVVLEIVSGKPSSEREQDKNEYLVHTACSLHERGTILELVDKSLMMASDDMDQAKDTLELAMTCLSISPENRPKMSYIASELGRIIRKEKRSFSSKFGGGCFV